MREAGQCRAKSESGDEGVSGDEQHDTSEWYVCGRRAFPGECRLLAPEEASYIRIRIQPAYKRNPQSGLQRKVLGPGGIPQLRDSRA